MWQARSNPEVRSHIRATCMQRVLQHARCRVASLGFTSRNGGLAQLHPAPPAAPPPAPPQSQHRRALTPPPPHAPHHNLNTLCPPTARPSLQPSCRAFMQPIQSPRCTTCNRKSRNQPHGTAPLQLFGSDVPVASNRATLQHGTKTTHAGTHIPVPVRTPAAEFNRVATQVATPPPRQPPPSLCGGHCPQCRPIHTSKQPGQ